LSFSITNATGENNKDTVITAFVKSGRKETADNTKDQVKPGVQSITEDSDDFDRDSKNPLSSRREMNIKDEKKEETLKPP